MASAVDISNFSLMSLKSKFCFIRSVAVESISLASSSLIYGISFMYRTDRRPVAERASNTEIPLNSFYLASFSFLRLSAYYLITMIDVSLLNSCTGL